MGWDGECIAYKPVYTRSKAHKLSRGRMPGITDEFIRMREIADLRRNCIFADSPGFASRLLTRG
jgi:hypothetical protein